MSNLHQKESLKFKKSMLVIVIVLKFSAMKFEHRFRLRFRGIEEMFAVSEVFIKEMLYYIIFGDGRARG